MYTASVSPLFHRIISFIVDGYDDEMVEQALDDGELLEFYGDLNDFPFKDHEDYGRSDQWKQEFILDLLQKFRENPNLVFKSTKC